MSTGSLQVFVDVGDQFNVIVDTSDVIVVSDDNGYYAVADYATAAATASYVLLSGIDGFSEYSSSVDNRLILLELFSSSLDSGFVTELELFTTASQLQSNIDQKLFTSSFYDYSASVHNIVSIESSSVAQNNNVNVFGNLLVNQDNTYTNLNKLIIRNNYLEVNKDNFERGGILVSNLSGSTGISGSLVWRTDTEAWYGGLLLSESRLLTQIDLDVLNDYTSSRDARIDSLRAVTGSYATTGSNTFVSDQIITGSVSISSNGLLIFTPRERPTGSIPGALFYSSSGELYVGM